MPQEHTLAIIPYQPIEEWRIHLAGLQSSGHPQGTSQLTEVSTTYKLVQRTKTFSNRRVYVTTLVSDEEDTCSVSSKVSFEQNVLAQGSSLAINGDTDSDTDVVVETISINTESSDYEIDEDIYEVDEILSVRAFNCNDNIIRQFKVSWVGYNEISWVDEGDLDCDRLVNEFFEKRGSREVEPLAGADATSDKFNFNNWTSISTVLKHVRQWENSSRHNAGLNVERFNGLQNKDCVYIMDHNCHLFVLMHYVDDKLIYISDGTNLYSRSRKIKREINKRIGKGVKVLTLINNVQRGQDFCGSTAAAIAITFLQKYAFNSWRNPLKSRLAW